jgi:protease I
MSDPVFDDMSDGLYRKQLPSPPTHKSFTLKARRTREHGKRRSKKNYKDDENRVQTYPFPSPNFDHKKKKVLMIIGEFSESTEVLSAITLFSVLGHELKIVSPDYKSGEKVILSSHYYEEFNLAKSSLRASHIYTSIDSKLCGLTHDFNNFSFNDCDILFLPGGSAPDYLQNDKKVNNIVKYFLENKKFILANCNGVKLLLSNLKGFKLTGPSLIEAQINNGGNFYEGDKVKVNINEKGCNIITAGPKYYNYMFKDFFKLIDE